MMKCLIVLLCLCACSKTEPSTAISQAVQKEITVLQKDIEQSTCDNKNTLIVRLDNIKSEIENVSLACSVEKDVLKEENKKLKIIITSLIIMCVCGVVVIKKRRLSCMI